MRHNLQGQYQSTLHKFVKNNSDDRYDGIKLYTNNYVSITMALTRSTKGPSVQDEERGVVASHGKRQEMKERQEEVRTRLSI